MNKNYFYLYSMLCFLTAATCGCKEDSPEPLPQTVPLTTSLNGKSFVMGDEIKVTLAVDPTKGDSLRANEDFAVRLTAKKSGSDDNVADSLFENFPSQVVFKKGEKSSTIVFKVKKTGISKLWNVDLGIFVRGYLFGKSMSTDTKTITVSDYHHTTLSVKDNPEAEINEGSTFTLVASVETAVEKPLTVTITPQKGEESHYQQLPRTLTIPQGKSSVESQPVTLAGDNKPTGNLDLSLSLQVDSKQYPLDRNVLTIKMKDSDKPLGDKLTDERWVYPDPNKMFMSDKNQTLVNTWKPGAATLMKEGDRHPNPELAKTWTFLNAIEFHNIKTCVNNNGNTTTCKFFAANNTKIAQTDAAVDNDKFTNIDQNGVMRIWGAKGNFTATKPISGKRDYGTAALYSSKFWPNQQNLWPVQNTRINTGIRVEIRARCRGQLNGSNPALWLLGNTDGEILKKWPNCGEIDILEVPTGSATGTNTAYQTFHFAGDSKGTDHPVFVKKPLGTQMQEWNIYWVEWRSDSEVALGINGETTLVLKKSSVSGSTWPFDMKYNPSGFKLIINLGLKNSWALGKTIPEGWDAGFAGIGYEESKTSDLSPHMDIDWVRYYKNNNYHANGEVWKGGKTY